MKEPEALSYSGITLFEQCPYKYMRTYDGSVDGKIERGYAASTIEGILVHNVLEHWHKDRSRDWRTILRRLASTQSDFDIMTSEQLIGAEVLLSEYMKRQDITPDIINTEVDFNVVLPNGIPVRGRIDRVDRLEDGIGLVDYKTTRSYIWKSEVENSLQGMIYVLVAQNYLYPNRLKYYFTIDALRFKPITVSFSEAQLNGAMDYLDVIYNRICTLDAQNAKPRINKFCGYCQLQHECPAFKVAKAMDLDVLRDCEGELTSLSIDDMAQRYLLYSEIEECGRKGRQRMETTLDEHLQQLSVRNLTTENYAICYEKTQYGNPKLKVEKRG